MDSARKRRLSCFDDRASSMRRVEQSQWCSNGGPIIQEFECDWRSTPGLELPVSRRSPKRTNRARVEVLQRGWPGSSDDNRQLCFAAIAAAVHTRNDSSRMETAPQRELDVLEIKHLCSGKVREVFDLREALLFVATKEMEERVRDVQYVGRAGWVRFP
jgi:hypothetical protein